MHARHKTAAAGRQLQLVDPIDRAFAELLQVHEKNASAGNPLLTAAGVDFVCRKITVAPNGVLPGAAILPHWAAAERQLWLGRQLLKQFRQPAPHQVLILNVFEEQGWLPLHIDDPLPLADGESEEDAKRRLHETVKNLNRGLPPGTIAFRGDGTGQGIVWGFQSSRQARKHQPNR